jgi:hypothetical protein
MIPARSESMGVRKTVMSKEEGIGLDSGVLPPVTLTVPAVWVARGVVVVVVVAVVVPACLPLLVMP